MIILIAQLFLGIACPSGSLPQQSTFDDIRTEWCERVVNSEVVRDGPTERYNLSSKSLAERGLYRLGKAHGVWEAWYPSKKFQSRTTFVNGIRSGPYTQWHENGNKAEEGRFLNGQPDGPWKTWYESGKPETTTTFVKGKENGQRTVWHETGIRKEHGKVIMGKQVGLWNTWYESGLPQTTGAYDHGLKEGIWTHYFENGTKSGEFEFTQGRITRTIQAPNVMGEGNTTDYKNFGKALE